MVDVVQGHFIVKEAKEEDEKEEEEGEEEDKITAE